MKLILHTKAQKQFKKLHSVIKKRLGKFFDKLETLDNPRTTGRALSGNLVGLWRYRVGDYRVICHICDDELVILCLAIAHRSDAYN